MVQFQNTDSILRKVFALSNRPHLYSNYLQLGPTKTSEKPIMKQNLFFFELTYLTLKVLQLTFYKILGCRKKVDLSNEVLCLPWIKIYFLKKIWNFGYKADFIKYIWLN